MISIRVSFQTNGLSDDLVRTPYLIQQSCSEHCLRLTIKTQLVVIELLSIVSLRDISHVSSNSIMKLLLNKNSLRSRTEREIFC